MKFLLIILSFVVCIFLQGCYTTTSFPEQSAAVNRPTPNEIITNDPGSAPSISKILATAREWGKERLKDPESAKYKLVLGPKKYWQRKMNQDQTLSPLKITWIAVVNINAKNSYGGYTGGTNYEFHWIDGSLTTGKYGEIGTQFFVTSQGTMMGFID
ncbi:hypothetical protein OAK16_03975 [Verrucomicrobia bacterium]|nr:hypothetical protein [Verrucomicrobiota bacterium]